MDEQGKFWGILNREQLRPFLLGKKLADDHNLSDLTISPSFVVMPTDPVMKVIKMFEEADVWQLPVLNEDREFLGFVSRSKLLTNYRSLLKDYSE